MNSRIPTPPPTGKRKLAKFRISAFYDGGQQVRNFNGEALVIEGDANDHAGLLISALNTIRDNGHFPEDTRRIEIESELF